jgi:hypothetical protein
MSKRKEKIKSWIILGLIIAVILLLVVGYLFWQNYSWNKPFETNRQRIISEIDKVLRKAVASGDYKCCINPPCKMCFLGNWIWQDGRCRCDEEIARGNWENVCPECRRSVEAGKCESTEINN